MRKGFNNLTATWNITWNHYNIKVSKKDYSQDYLRKKLYFAKFRILQLLLESWFSTPTRGLGNLAAICCNMVSLLRQSFSENLESELSSEKLVICEISHFTTFVRILIFSPTKRVGQLYSCL